MAESQNNSAPTKVCKYCKSEIPADAKICPHCRKKQGGKGKIIIIAVIVIIVLFAIAGGGSSSSSETSTSNKNTSVSAEPTPTATPIEYAAYSVDDMVSDLKSNALNASTKYKGQYIEITGRLTTIDSSGKYICLEPVNDPYTFTSVMCYIQNDEQLQQVSQMSTDQTVTLRGKCTDVGEVLGFYLDIDSIG